jgi:glycosyltransferase involved in cell wall biosynthesis
VCSLNKNLALTAALHRLTKTRKHPRLILWHHDLAWTTPRYRQELYDGYPWELLRIDWPWAQQVVVSEPRRRELGELLGIASDRIEVIPNGINLSVFLKLTKQTQQFASQFELESAAPLILLPVRITPRKNIELALNVVAILRSQFQNAKLIVTGPLGPHNPANAQYFERLLAVRAELKIEDAALFLAELNDQPFPDEVIADFYQLADLLLLPSREEGFGIPVLEAGLAGVPIFCSDIAALRDLGGNEAHYFSPDDDPGQIAAKISTVLKSSSGYALRKRVMQGYTWEQIYAMHIAPLLAEG